MNILKKIAFTTNVRDIGNKEKGTRRRVCDVHLMNPKTCTHDVSMVDTSKARGIVTDYRKNWVFTPYKALA